MSRKGEFNARMAQDTISGEKQVSSREINDALSSQRRSKYGVSAKEDRTADNVTFDSKREMLRYLDLKKLQRAGIITNLELQPAFPLIVNKVKVCTYQADFRYEDLDGRDVIEDVKGARTATYRLKYKLFHAVYPDLRILET